MHPIAATKWCVWWWGSCRRLPCSGSTLQHCIDAAATAPRPRVRVARMGAPARRSSAMYEGSPSALLHCITRHLHLHHHSGLLGHERLPWKEAVPPRKTICASHPLCCCGTPAFLWGCCCCLQMLRASGAGHDDTTTEIERPVSG
jgi:hypothetical protein